MPRNRRIDRALNVPNRGIWVATLVVVLLGLVVLWWVFSPTERRRTELVDRLRFGDDAERVAALLGPPAARCPGTILERLQGSFPEDWAPATVAAVGSQLERETGESWVYPLRASDPADCAPGERETVIGLSRDQRVLWIVGLTGRTPLRAPEGIGVDTTLAQTAPPAP